LSTNWNQSCFGYLSDLIRGFASSESDDQQMPKLAIFEEKKQRVLFSDDTKAAPILPPQIVVVSEGSDSLQHIVTVGIDTQDQVGLLLDISKALLRLNLQLHHCEAGVLDQRSLSVWKCEALEKGEIDDEEIWSVLSVSAAFFSLVYVAEIITSLFNVLGIA